MLTNEKKVEIDNKIFVIRNFTDEFYNYKEYSDILVNPKNISTKLIKYMKENEDISGMTIVTDSRYEDNIGFMKDFNRIKHLFLGTNDFRSIEILSRLDELENLYFEGVSKEAFDFSLLNKLAKLNILYHDKVTNDIFHCIQLEYLRISHYKHKSKTIDEFASLVNLKRLELRQAAIYNINALSNMNQLEALELAYLHKLENIDGLKKLESMTDLTILNCKKIKNWEIIGLLKNLKKIYICSCGIIPSIKFLAGLEKIEKIHISDTKMEDGEVSCIFNSKNLQQFHIQVFKHYDVSCEQMREFNDRKM